MTVAEPAVSSSLDLSVLLGEWLNTNAAGSIARIVCQATGDGRMTVACEGRSVPEPRPWGRVDAPVYAFTFESREAGAFSAVFDLDFMEIRLQANVKSGVLVVASFNHFRDDSGRSNYFDREFFYRIP
jgi:hypothetical protein